MLHLVAYLVMQPGAPASGRRDEPPLAAVAACNGVELGVVIFFFLVVTAGGFLAARWRRAASMHSLDEWGLGGRGFGTVVTWFLLGGDLYTAYTFVAVPAAMFATGAVSGFFAVPYTIVVYPLIFIFMPRLWSVSHRRGYVTPADFVRGRYDSRLLALAVAVTGIVATMPYIALQLVGIQAVLDTMGLGGSGNWFVRDLPLIIAFAVLAAYTYSSGLRAPALIAFVKDTLIYLVIIVAIVYVGVKIGFGGMFDAATRRRARPRARCSSRTARPTGPTARWPSVPRWRCSCTRTRSPPCSPAGAATSSGATPRSCRPTRSCSACSRCSASPRSTRRPSVIGQDGKPNAQLVVPHFFDQVFPSWFAGVAFAAIAIGALVPAAIMSIAAANLFTRNVYREFLVRDASPAHEARVAKIISLVVKFGALLFVLGMDRQNAINLQLLGGVWILQTILSIVAGLYTRWFHRWALLAGWAVAMVYGTVVAYHQSSATTKHFGSSLAVLPVDAHQGLHRGDGAAPQRDRLGRADAGRCGSCCPGRCRTRRSRRTTTPTAHQAAIDGEEPAVPRARRAPR